MAWRRVEDPLGHLPTDPIRMTTVGLAGALTRLIQLVGLPFVVAWKIALRRPAKVEAVPLDDPDDARSWQVAGYGAGRHAMQVVAERIRAGHEPALPT